MNDSALQPDTPQCDMSLVDDGVSEPRDFKLSFVQIKKEDTSILFIVANKTLSENSRIQRKVKGCTVLARTSIFTVYQKRGKCDWLERIFGNKWFFVSYHLLMAWLILYGIDAMTLNFFKY